VPMELAQAPLFDFQVINDVLTKAIEEAQSIVHSHLQKS